MRILFLSPYVPFPVVHGGRNRVRGLLECLTRFAEVRVLAAGDPRSAESAESRAKLSSIGVTLDVFPPTGPGPAEADPDDVLRRPDALAHFRCPDLTAALPRVTADFAPDVVHFEELVMAQYASAVTAPRVADRQKVEWRYHDSMSEIEPAKAAAHRREAARFQRFEADVAPLFAKTLVIGQTDKEELRPFYRDEDLSVVPIGVDASIRPPADRTSDVRHVLLYGTLDYGPNADANAFYFREVWPKLASDAPSLRTRVVGSGAPPAGSVPRSDPRVEMTGYVPDIASILGGPGVLVVPLRVGGGARTKILEALAAGMPVVSTAIGVENLGLEPGRHYLRAENAAETVAAVLRLTRDAALAARLGREGAAHVDAQYRWEAIGRQIEPLYVAAMRTRPIRGGLASRSRRALLVGVRPWPRDEGARRLSFPGHRAAQFHQALERAGYEIASVLLDEDEDAPLSAAEDEGETHVLAPERFRAGIDLARVHADWQADIVVAAGGYHPARAVCRLETDRPLFIDLAGDLGAEGQLQAAASGNGVLADYLSVLSLALLAGDRFSAVGPSQRLALLGQLGLSGRLTGETVGRDPVSIVPLCADGPASVAPAGGPSFRVLWSGGYNTWMDVATLIEGLEKAMAERDDLVFESTGGTIPGHDEATHRLFWERARASRFAARFRDHGRVTRREALEILDRCHVLLSVSRPCLEAELGSRQRVVEALAHGRAVVMTADGDLAAAIAGAEAGIVVPGGDAGALAAALDRAGREEAAFGARARELWESRYTPDQATAPLRAWAERPERWPRSVLAGEGLPLLASERLRLQSELDAVRGSRTFRALRVLDRLLGR